MFATRFSSINRPAYSFVRLFSSSPIVSRVPSIHDITPVESVHVFNSRRKEFRENLEATRKAKEEERRNRSIDAHNKPSSSTTDTTSSSREFSNTPDITARSDTSGSTSDKDQARLIIDAAEETPLSSQLSHGPIESDSEQSSKRGPLASLIYGTKEAHLHAHELERSFSEVLARGKYVHSIVFHEVKPDKVPEYVDVVGKYYPHVASIDDNKVHLVGSWRTQVGDNNTFGKLISKKRETEREREKAC